MWEESTGLKFIGHKKAWKNDVETNDEMKVNERRTLWYEVNSKESQKRQIWLFRRSSALEQYAIKSYIKPENVGLVGDSDDEK